MAMNSYHSVIIVVLCASVRSSVQQILFVDIESSNESTERTVPIYFNLNNNAFIELPPNITIPSSESEQVISEMNEPDSNRTGLLQWIFGIAGFNKPTPAPDSPVPPENCSACTCGVANKNKRIVGGQETQVNEYPWMTLLKYGRNFYCGASLISDKYVLTAAHCVNGFDFNRISALFQEHDRKNPSDTNTLTRKIVKAIKHPKYNNRNYDNDLALLKLNESVPLDGSIRPVCMPPVGETFEGFEAIITGWGAIEEGGALATKLQEVTVPIMSNDNCKKTMYGPNRITDNMMCAGISEGGKDSCQGDSGGPLHVVIDNKYHEAGIVSWGQGCAEANYPGVYTRVNHYTEWIKDNTKDACYC